ncbi:MAG: lyase family protein, partial [Candidatus Wallbacteria bacterium]|nr:lyase family protein [Candidatus Wallbacteria bacterium]
LDGLIERFTVGSDPMLDMELLPFDCRASAAHARMLEKCGFLSAQELSGLVAELEQIEQEAEAGKIVIPAELEDCHTFIESRLTEKLGSAGEKIHTARSRNDQVLTALRLYEMDRLSRIEDFVAGLASSLKRLSERSGSAPLPGYTHTRKAMPLSVAVWAGCFCDALFDDIKLVDCSRDLLDQCPLGTGAGFGVPLAIDRQYTADLLGFSRVQENPVYAQLSRGKFELSVLHALSQIMFDLNRMASDMIFYSMPELGCFKLPDKFCTGSSIMPQKKTLMCWSLCARAFMLWKDAPLQCGVFASI